MKSQKIAFQPHRLRLLLGSYCLTGGIIINLCALKEHDACGNKLSYINYENTYISQLCTKGIYNYTRNPMYLGGILMALSLPLFIPNPYIIFIDACIIQSFLVYCHYHDLPLQEEYLRNRFGNEYNEYEMNVRRWIGRYTFNNQRIISSNSNEINSPQ